LIAAEARRAERAPRPDSMDLYFQGAGCLNKAKSAEHMTQARGLFERALARDPDNVEALVGTANVDVRRGMIYVPDDRAVAFATAEATLAKALSLVPEHALAHFVLGLVQMSTNRVRQGIAECERALALDRNLARGHAALGIAKYYLGVAEETEAHINEAFRLSPRDTDAHIWLAIAGTAKLLLGRDEEAIVLLRRSIENNRNLPAAHFWLAATLAHLGKLNEARAAVQAGLALNPSFTMKRSRTGGPPSDNQTYLAQRERIYEGFRKAGVPEG
jgi:tetratricopeptide (TPR) repeat protein